MIRIGIICPSDIAERRFLPSLQQNKDFCFVGVGIAAPEEWFGDKLKTTAIDNITAMKSTQRVKAQNIVNQFGGRIFDSYHDIIHSDEVDAIYIPLPPALHYSWTKKVLLAGKHAFVEKPFTTNLQNTLDLLNIAAEKKLAVQENYMFIYHQQLNDIEAIIDAGDIGEIRLYRLSFCFPLRALNDFRYNKVLGGGAILDCCGYTIKYVSKLLGSTARVVQAQSNFISNFVVDMYGSAVMVNDQGLTAQLAFGMDNSYKCELEVWGSEARLLTNRVLTAPAGLVPEVTIIDSLGNQRTMSLSEDDAFGKSIAFFSRCIIDAETRDKNYEIIERQSNLLNQFIILANK